MSQQINLLNHRLQRRQDAFSLRTIAIVLAGVLLVGASLVVYAVYQRSLLSRQEAAFQAENKRLQLEVEATTRILSERKANPALAVEISQYTLALQPREEALSKLKAMDAASDGFVSALRGLSRQNMTGVWLTEFMVSASDLTIRGRLVDSALLPVYVHRLNEEPAFKGRRFAALDMKGVEPPPLEKGAAVIPAGAVAADGAAAMRLPPFVEFTLQGALALPVVSKQGGAK